MKGILLFFVIASVLISCDSYNKVIKSDDYALKFQTADTLYNSGKYARSIVLYEQIYQRFPKTDQGEVAYYRIGKAYYNEKDYYMAGYYLGSYSSRFPFSPKAEEALFLSALCSVQNSPEPSLDPNETELAIKDLQMFINRFPNSTYLDSCNQTIDNLRKKLEIKDYEAVKHYSLTEYYRAAVVSAISFMEKYPLTEFKEEVSFLLVKNSYLLSINSVDTKKKERIEETIQRYRTFVSEFPQSEYKSQADAFRDKLEKELQLINQGK
jgi:outer membrane protein assembly factor BamD